MPWFSNDFRRNKNLILILEARFGCDPYYEHSRQEKCMFKVNNGNTRTNCEICSKFIRTALVHIRMSQLALGVQFGTLKLYFQTGL